jgi:parallel beta-helix repeat protein
VEWGVETKRLLFGVIVALLMFNMLTLALRIQPARSSPTTITVPDDYPTIQAAVDAAAPGDTVYVRAGTYYENVKVNKTLSLVGENPQNTTIDGGGNWSADVVNVEADYVDVKGFTIRNGSGYILEPHAGITLNGANYCTVEENNVENNWWDGIILDSSCNSIVVRNNVTADMMDGIVVGGHGYNDSVVGNNIGGNQDGVALGCSNTSVVGNNISYNMAGIFLGSDFNNIVGNNMIHDFWGFWCEGCNNNSIVGNNIAECTQYGFYFGFNCNNNSIVGNNVTDNNLAVYSHSGNNIFYHDNFVGNTVQVIGGFTNVWDDGYPAGGNYWSDYAGQDSYRGPYQNDTGSDGIGDAPYIIDANSTDNYPLTIADVAISNITLAKTVVGQRYGVSVNATLQNGVYEETFNVTVYANAAAINETQITLTSRNSTIITLTWDTTGFAFGNYTLNACAWPVPGEVNIENNKCTCDITIHVGVPGDVSGTTPGVYDGTVNMKDVAYLVSLFNTFPGKARWDPNADVNNDGLVNMKDIAIAVYYFNQHE